MDNQFAQNRHRWGVSEYLYVGATAALSVAYGKKGGASSKHYHRHKHNTFIVMQGTVRVVSEKGPAGLTVALGPQESFTVAAGVLHRMEFVTDAVLHEVYQAIPGYAVELGDIIRLDNGWPGGDGAEATLKRVAEKVRIGDLPLEGSA